MIVIGRVAETRFRYSANYPVVKAAGKCKEDDCHWASGRVTRFRYSTATRYIIFWLYFCSSYPK
ncbi:hypothetical protein I3760_07G095800 [Carya illinoinensis]|nr:hypothetical protein I3760_07G095800 [Carya illinoinensis]